jgi:predicted nucleic acid-binding protein
MSDNPFFDTNVIVYAFVKDDSRADVSLGLMTAPCIVSLQVLHEFVDVAVRKLRMSWKELLDALDIIHLLCPRPLPITIKTHEKALEIARRYGYRIFDSLHIASALESSCSTLYSEDMRHGQVIEGLTIRNPFRQRPM